MPISEEDQAILDQLLAHGDNAQIPRPIVHFIYGDTRSVLEEVAAQLSSPKWSKIEIGKGSDDFCLRATWTSDVQTASIEEMMAEVFSAIVELDVDYDGWETSVEKVN